MSVIRRAEPGELPALARLWEAGWYEAHEGRLPPGLVALRTPASFRSRIAAYGDALRVAGPTGAPLGFCVAQRDEIEQLFVAPAARGTGLAARLLADGEARLRAAGVETGRIACAVGNDRALRFYARHGWHGGVEPLIAAGGFPIEVVALRKPLARQAVPVIGTARAGSI